MRLPDWVLNAVRYLPGGLEGVLLVLLLWQLAGLVWWPFVAAAPPGNLTLPAAAPAARTSLQALQDWYAPPQALAEPVTDLTLLAVVSGQQGVAVLRTEAASTMAVRVGEEIQSGSRLVRVSASEVEIERHGQRQRLSLAGLAVSASASVVVVPAPSRPVAQAVQSAAPASRLTRGQLSGLMQGGNLADWSSGLVSYREGGILLEDLSKQPLMRTLKLRRGDVIRAANDRPLEQLSDISLLYHQLSQQASIELSVLRDGSLQTLSYKIQP